MKYITILNFKNGEIHIFSYPNHIKDDFEHIIEYIEENYNISFSENNCQWIIQDKLNLQIH